MNVDNKQTNKQMSLFKVYNDADILEKIMKDRRRDLGPVTDDDDMMSPKLKISMSLSRPDLLDLIHLTESYPIKCVSLLPVEKERSLTESH